MLSALKHHPRLLMTVAVIAMLAATTIAYYPGLHGPFLFDDITNIVQNPALVVHTFSLESLLHAAFSSRSGVLYRPLSMLSFAANASLSDSNAFLFKITNLGIHLINALLILWLTRRLLLSCRRRYQFDWKDLSIKWASVLIAAVWALHPLNLTAVLYVVQRMTSLSALFTLAGILSYVIGRERMLAGKSGWPLVWLLTLFFGVIGVLCKEDAALLPLYLLVIEWLLFGFRNSRQTLSKNILAFYGCGLLLSGVIGLTYLISHPQLFLGNYAYRDFTLPERVLTEFRVVWLYIQWTYFPDIRHLAMYHDDIVVSKELMTPHTTLWSLLALVVLLVITWWQRKRRPLLSLGILFFFAGQVMESTILPLELAFEHRNYLPDYGLILAAFSLLLLPTTSSQRHARMSLRWAAAVLTIPVLFTVTHLRAFEWDNYLDFTYYEAYHHPDSPRAVYSLGQMYAILAMQGNLKNPSKALDTLTRAASISDNIMPDVAMMIVSAKTKQPINPAWLQHAMNILNTQPLFPQDLTSFNSLVNCLPKDCMELAPAAHTMLMSAFHAKNLDSIPHGAADLWTIYSNYLTFMGAPLSQILVAMHKAVMLEPGIPQYHINLAKGLMVSGDYAAAEAQIRQLSRLNLFGSLDPDIQSLNASLTATRALHHKNQLEHAHTGDSSPTQNPKYMP